MRQQVGHKAPISVLDLASGKGGDMLKWKKGDISHLIFAGWLMELFDIDTIFALFKVIQH